MRDLVPCGAFSLTAWDPLGGTHRHVPLASEGYSQAILDHGCDDFIVHNPAYRLIRDTAKRGLRWRDISKDWGFDFQGTLTAEKYLLPAGFKEGLTACLWTSDGRYTGTVSVSWERAPAATDRSRDVIENFLPVLASVCDLLRKPAALAEALTPNANAVVVSSRSVVSELPGRNPGPHLGPGGELVALLSGPGPTLSPGRALWVDRDGGYHRTEVIASTNGSVLVAEEPVERPAGLTARELQILHLLSAGATNSEIAERLVVSTRTVATHVEHLLAKLDCENRVQLTVLAVERGLRLVKEPVVEPMFTSARDARSSERH